VKKNSRTSSNLLSDSCKVTGFLKKRVNNIILDEFDRDISEADAIVRFDFMRHIFLERNL